eukprot:gene32140-47916_t
MLIVDPATVPHRGEMDDRDRLVRLDAHNQARAASGRAPASPKAAPPPPPGPT